MKRTSRRFFFIVTTLALGGAARAELAPQAVFEAYVAAVNSGDMAGVDALIGANPGRPPRNFCPKEQSNRDCMLSYLQNTIVTKHTVLLPVKTAVAGDVVTARLEARNDLTRAAHVERFVGSDRITVRGGKIVEFAFIPDRRDVQTVKFFRYMRSTR